MGEAKNRSSFDQRKEATTKDMDFVGDLIKRGEAPHYAVVMDRSPFGVAVLKHLRKGPDELCTRFTSEPFKFWEQSHFEFVVVWGTFGYSGGLTINALDLDTLLNEALPAAIKRTTEKGGFCSFVLGIDPALREKVEAKLAELQPSTGTAQ